jgi:hypothetical protein
LLACGLLGCCLWAPISAAPAGEKPRAKTSQGAPAADPMMAEMMKYANPGPEHEILKGMAGTWKTTTKSWMAPGEPEVSEGTSEVTAILGGRYVKEEFSSTFGGQPFHGMGLTGYDLMKKQYVGTWIDSMGTSIMTSRGTYDSATRQFASTATYTDPMTMKEKTTRMVTKIFDGNKHVSSFYDTMDGKEVMTMEITYTRK